MRYACVITFLVRLLLHLEILFKTIILNGSPAMEDFIIDSLAFLRPPFY